MKRLLYIAGAIVIVVGLVAVADSMNNAPDESCVDSWNRFVYAGQENARIDRLRNTTVVVKQSDAHCLIAESGGQIVMSREERAVNQDELESGAVSRDELIAWVPEKRSKQISGSVFDGDTSSGKYRTNGEARISHTNVILFWK